MKLIFLGTNGWYNTSIGNTTCIFLESEKEYIIFDAGDGLYKIDRFIKQKKPIYLFLSHFHLDHISGLHTLNKFNFPQGLKIYSYEGMKKILNKIICFPYTMFLNDLPYPVDLFELKEGDEQNLPFSLKCLSLIHSAPCFGYRLNIENKIITYCPDTGICENALKLARDADFLMCECSLKAGQDRKDWPHLNPHSAAQIAKQSNAKKLALIHFNPYFYPALKDRERAEKEAKEIFANTFYAKDDMEIIL
ncbi:MAG: MBL fold metallo-hydrolase [Candidatus Omnitrophica bacterium]|nr:MBL fold metallo-hydrolase [Candidatus Omnitrophota bacterium]